MKIVSYMDLKVVRLKANNQRNRKRELASDWVYDSCDPWIAPPVLKFTSAVLFVTLSSSEEMHSKSVHDAPITAEEASRGVWLLFGSVANNENHMRFFPASQSGKMWVETVDELEAISDTLQPNPESDGKIELLWAANASGNVLITTASCRCKTKAQHREVTKKGISQCVYMKSLIILRS